MYYHLLYDLVARKYYCSSKFTNENKIIYTRRDSVFKSYGLENNKTSSIVTKDGIVRCYKDDKIIIFQRNLHLSNDQLHVIRNRIHL